MRSFKLTLVAVLLAAVSSCIGTEEAQVEFYPEKEVTLNTKRIVAQSETAFARLQADPDFRDYTHVIPSQFNVYFIATSGSDQNTVIKKFEGLTEGANKVVVPARSYRVIITNYNNFSEENNGSIRRDRLPESSHALYLFGEETIDYKTLSAGEVTVTNDYAASMIRKSDMVKSTPSFNQTAYFQNEDYYILYLRDQGGASSFAKNTTFSILKPDGGTGQHNLQHTYTANKVSRFHFKLYGETDGNLNIVVDENILKAIEDKVIVPNY